MAPRTMETILAELGSLMAEDLGMHPEGAFLYAEGQQGVSAAAIYKDLGDRVVCRFPGEALTDRLFELWNIAEADKKWGALFYMISGDKFDAWFQYPHEWSPDESYDDRLDRVIEMKYGNKPIEYTPMKFVD